ncbi:peptidase U32 family protein [Geotoga petraea]|uniref:U32 family peptidase n=1 Tax=Geotoga petraea TaxID=28234 RepID=A0A4Z0VZR3_9BACT|nr:U32 family peptidase [Geotoga petraea]TGG87577.1 U32 family peptidase [Geotoga petraea]
MKKIELLSPAGNYEKLDMVYRYGADAAYIGGKMFNLRAFADNFNDDELENAVKLAHSLNKKLYVTLNIIPHNNDLERMPEYVKYLDTLGLDGIIVADMGVFQIVKENSNIPINISTQASNTNWASVKMWKDLGAKRVILAREVSIKEIREIRDKVPDIELEAFVHGAMCMSISGRCLLSNYMTGRDANRGACAQPCRWKYNLVEEKRPGQYFPIGEDERGTYIMNSKDLCTIEFLDQMIDAGLDSLKIEGRMKGIYYAATTTKIYRQAIDEYYEKKWEFKQKWLDELMTISHRNYTSGFYFKKPGTEDHNYDSSAYKHTHKLVAKVLKDLGDDHYLLEVRNKLNVGDEVEIIQPKGDPIKINFPEMQNNKNGENIVSANPNTIIKIKTELDLSEKDMIRKKVIK